MHSTDVKAEHDQVDLNDFAHIGNNEPGHDRRWNREAVSDDQKMPSWSAFNSVATTQHIAEQIMGVLSVATHPVTD